jgi:hypothetical protein
VVIKVLIEVEGEDTPRCKGDLINILYGLDDGQLEGCVKFKVCED